MSWPQNFVQSYVTHKTGENEFISLFKTKCVVLLFVHVLMKYVFVCEQ